MYLIRLTLFSGYSVTVNLNNVAFIQDYEESTLIHFHDKGNYIRVVESYEEINEILEEI